MNRDQKSPITKRYVLMYPDGTTAPATINTVGDDKCLNVLLSINLEGHANYAFSSHMDIMQKLELVDYESASDKGHYRYYYKGALMFELIRAWLKQEIVERFNAYEVRTPFIYDWKRPDIQGQAGLFSDQIYRVFSEVSDREFALRYGGDAGVFSIMKDAQLTYRHLPFRLFEDCHGFRITMSGEVSGIRRGRAFSFPDIHSFCADFDSGLLEYARIHELHLKLAKDLEIDTATLFKITEELYPRVETSITAMTKMQGRPSLLEIMSAQKQYWAMKHIGYSEHPQKIFHVQLDLEDGERYSMRYINEQGEETPLVVIHNSIGSIEKWLILALEEALRKDPPILPLWLAPIQLRFIPVHIPTHGEFCQKIAHDICDTIRVDVDDRELSLGKRIKLSEMEWTPNIIVVGDQELKSNIYPLRTRGKDTILLPLNDIVDRIKNITKDMPFRPLPEIQVSQRPRFR